ncbi:MAG TPA: TonB family protein [Rhizomicrobium sp.]|nr:TonB family protein [Rhizomicrobium sp.]
MAAWAQSTPASNPTGQGAAPNRTCATFYNGPVVDFSKIDGTTSVTVTPADGDAPNVEVTKSSGDSSLDTAAINCALSMGLNFKVGGRPLEVHSEVKIPWKDFLQTPAVQTASAPAATGNPHVCGHDLYPPAALAAGEQGVVGLAFRIGQNGSPKGITVSSSSGYSDLDQAAVTCAAQWKYTPSIQNGQPAEIDWKASVTWSMEPKIETTKITWSTFSAPPTPEQIPIGSHVCKNPDAPAAPLGKRTVLFLRVTSDGGVDNVRIRQSSGDAKLDGYGIACVDAWRFTPWTGSIRHHLSTMIVPLNW